MSRGSTASGGLIENPLFEGRVRDRIPRGGGGSHSAPVSRQVSEQVRPGSQERPRVQRTVSRSKSVRQYISRNTASFFGVNHETEQESLHRWTERRKRMLSKKYGRLKERYLQTSEHQAERYDAHLHATAAAPTAAPYALHLDVTDSPAARTASTSSQVSTVTLRQRQKEPVYRLTITGLNFLARTVSQRLSSYQSQSIRFRGRPASWATSGDNDVFNDEWAAPSTHAQRSWLQSQSSVQPDTAGEDAFFEKPASPTALRPGLEVWPRRMQEADRGPEETPEYRRTQTVSGQWHRPSSLALDSAGPDIGMNRIWDKMLNRAFDNSNRREYGVGLVGKLLNRSFRKERITSDVKEQLDDIDDHRPYFTYWVTTVQVLITIISLAVYGFGPLGFHKTQRSGLVLVTSLSLQQVDYFEPDNFWIGPRAADLVHLGAKFTPCMRKDRNIFDAITRDRQTERNTACCVRNDQSGCVQTSRDKCSELISTWRKWNISVPGPPRWIADPATIGADRRAAHRRLSGSVCGQDPRYCEEPASIYPYEWPDDITKWPVCRRPLVRQQSAEPHMACEVIGRPCCIGIYGECRITTREYCDFVKGFFHEEAALCSQVSCLADVCGMIPFHNPEVPDQFYRLWTALFLHAGLLHLLITVIVQYFIMRDLEKLTGPLRIGIIYVMSGIAGNLSSAIFVPYRAEVGPAGSQFGLLACLFVEVIHCWQMLKRPGLALLRLSGVALLLFLVGLLPWVDNYAHLFGFIFGFLLSYALLPFVSFGTYDRTTKVILIWVCLVVLTALFVGLMVLFYVHPIYECSFCKYLNCIPIVRDFCENQDISISRHEL